MRHTYTALIALFLSSLLVAPVAAQSNQVLEKNKAVVRRLFEEALCQANWDLFEQIHAKDFVVHRAKRDATLAEDLEAAKEWTQAFPDGKCEVNQLIAEGDMVAVRWSAQGTNTGTGNGLPATGKPARISGVTFFRVKDGKLAEEWGMIDMWGLLKQLGLAGSPK